MNFKNRLKLLNNKSTVSILNYLCVLKNLKLDNKEYAEYDQLM